MRMHPIPLVISVIAMTVFPWSPALAQDGAAPSTPARPARTNTAKADAEAAAAQKKALEEAVNKGVELILGMQEGDSKGEWPYEGVYRVQGQIPIGYRIGGTAIGALALLNAPGYIDEPADGPRHGAVKRALAFTSEAIKHPLMSFEDYDAGYDVRGWGYTYSLLLCTRLKAMNAIPDGDAETVEKIVAFDLEAIRRTEIPQAGGWNYARPAGRNTVAPASPFMTAPTLQALFEARKLGYEVDEAVVTRGLESLERSRGPAGAISYSSPLPGKAARDPVPGAVGRMLATETTLYLAGRSTLTNIRGALDAFIVHWEWLNKRRAQQGTHVPPYQIAPYYFYYAHYYAAAAVELLPSGERAEYRRRINDLLMSVRLEDGSWNDRVFKRTANFGTSMAVMAILMPSLPKPAEWKPADAAPAAPAPTAPPSEPASKGPGNP